MFDKKRFAAREMNAMLHLHAAECALDMAADLEKRLRGAKKWAMYKGVHGMVKKLVDTMEDEMPDHQRAAHRRNCGTLRYGCYVKSPAGAHQADDGLWLSYEAANAIMTAAREYCLTCTLDAQEMRSCRLQKALDTLPMKNADYNNPNCPYFGGL